MPRRALTICAVSGCGVRVAEGRCALHHQKPWNGGRGSGPGWRKVRAQVLHEEPVCRNCRHRKSTECDHIVPVSQGGTDERGNLAGVCRSCHREKTQREAADRRWPERG